ncbi:MAG: L,D-transpeptidase family protein [Paracoccaceae bacterium]
MEPTLTPLGLRAFGRTLPCTVGRGGIVQGADKREGDGATPTGRHRIEHLLYRPDRHPCPPVPHGFAHPIRPGELWSDAADDASYNALVRAPYAPSHEALRRADPLYDLVIVLGWNRAPTVAGRGSAIFVHRWRRPGHPTEGCIALRPDHLDWLAARLRPGMALKVPAALAR